MHCEAYLSRAYRSALLGAILPFAVSAISVASAVDRILRGRSPPRGSTSIPGKPSLSRSRDLDLVMSAADINKKRLDGL